MEFLKLLFFGGVPEPVAADGPAPREKQSTRELESSSLRARISAGVARVEAIAGPGRPEKSGVIHPQALASDEGFESVIPSQPFRAKRMPEDFVVMSHGAVLRGSRGDWLVKFPWGEYTVCSDRDFRNHFRPPPKG